jgi:GxxExxY protein
MEFDPLSNRVIGCAIEVHRHLGPGLLESACLRCLSHEMTLSGLKHEAEKALPLAYKGVSLDCGYRLDLLVEDELIVELKCVEKILPIHRAQLLTYMKLTGKHVGLLINFNEARLVDGLERMVL